MKPRTEQLRFLSSHHGEVILDAYLEAAEKGGRTIADLFSDIFDNLGRFRTDIFQFRENPNVPGQLQARVGDFVDPEYGWENISSTAFQEFVDACAAYVAEAQNQVSLAEDQVAIAAGHVATALGHSNTASGHSADALAYANQSMGYRDASNTYAGQSATARDASQVAQDLSEDARDASQAAQLLSEAARDKAEQWADNPEDVAVEPGQFSAKHHAIKASEHEGAAAGHASDAAASASFAETWADTRQPLDATLTAIAGLTITSDRIIYSTGVDTFATAPITSYGRALLNDPDAATARETLGLDNVNNTSDANKPVSTATQAALDTKVNKDGDTITGPLVVAGGARNAGMVGTYDSTKTQQIWAMGTSYLSSADGTDFGSLYGFAYKHTNNPTGGTMAGGHQVVWCTNGTPTAALGANIWTSGNVSGYSDIRVKKNIVRISDALAGIRKLNGYSFDRVDIEMRQIGVIAQEVQEVFPDLVTGDKDAWSVAYGNFAGVFIEAIKEIAEAIDTLKAKVEALEEAGK